MSLSFNQAVETSGEVTVRLLLDGGQFGDREVDAVYESGNESETLVFGYEVTSPDEDGNGIGVAAGSETSGFGGSGTIRAAGTTVAFNPTHPGLADADRHKVDGVPPIVQRLAFLLVCRHEPEREVYTRGDWIGVAMVMERGRAGGGLAAVGAGLRRRAEDGDLWCRLRTRSRRWAQACRSSATTWRWGDQDADGFAIGPNKLSLNGGSIKDRAGNDAAAFAPWR